MERRVVAPAGDGGEHACHNSERPPARNDHPAGTFSFRALEQHIRDHSVAQQYQYERTHELTKTLHKHVRTPFLIKTFLNYAAQSKERVTARFQRLYISSRFPLLRFGCHVWSTAQFARRSFKSFKYPTTRPAPYARPTQVVP